MKIILIKTSVSFIVIVSLFLGVYFFYFADNSVVDKNINMVTVTESPVVKRNLTPEERKFKEELSVLMSQAQSIGRDIAILEKKIAFSTDPIEKEKMIAEMERLRELSRSQAEGYSQIVKERKEEAARIREDFFQLKEEEINIQSHVKNVGDNFIIEDIEYKIIAVENLGDNLSKINNISEDIYYGYEKTQGKFIVIKFEAINVGKFSAPVEIRMVIKDDKERHYVANGDITYQSRDSDFLGYTGESLLRGYYDGELLPGFEGKYLLVFEVAQDSENLVLFVVDSSGRILHEINLDI